MMAFHVTAMVWVIYRSFLNWERHPRMIQVASRNDCFRSGEGNSNSLLSI